MARNAQTLELRPCISSLSSAGEEQPQNAWALCSALLRLAWGVDPGCQQSHLGLGTSSKLASCWQGSVLWGCRTEVRVFLPDASSEAVPFHLLLTMGHLLSSSKQTNKQTTPRGNNQTPWSTKYIFKKKSYINLNCNTQSECAPAMLLLIHYK